MIAITGASCCLPGGIETIEEFWEALLNGENMATDVPKSRWNNDRFFHPDPEVPGKTYMKRGHFVERDLTMFDYDALKISKREAEGLDPQQRLLLELTWQAMENAGVAVDNMDSRKVGVYAGGFTLDHFLGQFSAENRHAIGVHTASGSTLTMLSNRISHTFDFQGPSMTIDTACSSSLVAFHYACEDLRRGLCDYAVVAGVNLMMRPEYPIGMAKGGFLAKDGRSKSFDISGDGYGRGEGGVVLVLRRQKDAELNNEDIMASCLASGVNQDGRTPGITLPSPNAQVELMDSVLTRNNIDPNHINYVEAHGTGTAAGDPIEARSISKIYGQRDENNLCYIGSAKSNVGHLEAGSGLVGVLKAALVAQNKVVPPIAGFNTANPKIELDAKRMKLADKTYSLESENDKPMVAVNSFGYGGTNAHAVLQHYSAPKTALVGDNKTAAKHNQSNVLLLSAATKKALLKRAQQAKLLVQQNQDNLKPVLSAFSAHSHLGRERKCFVFEDKIDLLAQINNFIDEQGDSASSCQTDHKRVAFVFTGMGPQWHAMGKQLWKESEVYRTEALAFDAVFKKTANFSILDELLKDEEDSRISETEYAQPANFLVQVALTATLRSYGIEPHAVTGHSVGEVSSAYISGMLSLEDAIRVSVNRSQLQGTLRGRGGMLAAAIDEETALELIKDMAPNVSIAAINSPTSVTLAGNQQQLDAISELLSENEVFNRALQVELPYHSESMDEIHDEINERLQGLTSKQSCLPCYSTVTGKEFNGAFDGPYWNKNVRQEVRFRDAIESMINDGYNYFVEVGPHPVLARSLKEIFDQDENSVCASTFTLRRDHNEIQAINEVVNEVYTQTNAFVRVPVAGSERVKLPSYPWDRKVVWNETWQTQNDRSGDLISPMLEREDGEPGSYITDLSLQHLDYLKSHIVDGIPVIPAAAILEAALEAGARECPNAETLRISNARFMRTLSLKNEGEQFLIRVDPNTRQLDVLGSLERKPGSFSTRMATMNLQASSAKLSVAPVSDCSVERNIDALYTMFNDVGLHSDKLFQTVSSLSSNVDETTLVAEVVVDESLSCEGYTLHPTLIDGVFQSTAAFISDTTSAFIPVGVDEMLFNKIDISPRKVQVFGTLNQRTENSVSADLTVCDVENKNVILFIKNMTVKRIKDLSDEQLMPAGNYQTNWIPVDKPKIESAQGCNCLLVYSDKDRIRASGVSKLLEQDGANVNGWNISESAELDHWQYNGCPLTLNNKAQVSELLDKSIDNVVIWTGFQELNPVAGPEVVMTLIEALRTFGEERNVPTKVTVVSNSGIQVHPREQVLAQSGAIIGALRVVWSEVEDVRVEVIDADKNEPITSDLIINEVLCTDIKDEIVYRSGQRLRAQVKNFPTPISDKQSRLSNGQHYRWVKSGKLWVKESHTPRNIDTDSLISIDFTAYGNTDEFARIDSVSPSLVVGHRNGKNIVGLIPTGASSFAQFNDKCIDLRTQLPSELVMNAALHAWAKTLIERHWINKESVVVTSDDPLGNAIANVATEKGATVYCLSSPENWSDEFDHKRGSVDLLAVPVSKWIEKFDLNILACGGNVVNLDQHTSDNDMASMALAIDGLTKCFNHFCKNLLTSVAELANAESEIHSLKVGATVSVTRDHLTDHPILDWRIPEIGCNAFDSSIYEWDNDNWMLVTGGLGGIGEKFIHWLTSQEVSKILVVGRSKEEKISIHPSWQKLTRAGYQLKYISADITKDDFVGKIKSFQQEYGLITTVAHLAGVIDDSQLSAMTSEAFAKVINVKAVGFNRICEAIPVSQLHTFISFSSIALITGNSRQSNYCAANHYIENATRNLNSLGVRALTVHTGAINDVGMIQRDKRLRQHIDNTGLSLISTNNLFVGIKQALLRGDSVVTAAGEPNWEKWSNLEVMAARSPRFDEVLANVGHGSTDIYESLRMDLAKADENAQQTILSEIVRDTFAPILRLESSEISLDNKFADLGFDSLMAAEVQSSLKKQLGIEVSILTLIGEGMSVRKLADIELKKMQLGVA